MTSDDPMQQWFIDNSNPTNFTGTISEAMVGADVFIGVSAPNVLTEADVAAMAKGSIDFALANPDPEIDPVIARKYATVVATGRSDQPNQINNVLAFPGIFRGLLDANAHKITDQLLVAAAEAIAVAGYFNAGQDCTAATRVIVQDSVYDQFVALLTEQAKQVAIGAPADEDVFLGPVNNANQLARITDLLSRVPAHAQVTTGGSALDRPGFFFPATVVAGLKQADELIQKEIFGPVITVQKFTDEAQAVTMANGVEYGLASSVWTTNHGTAMRMAKAFDFGCVWINTHIPIVAEMPHGGFKQSGYGKDLSMYALEDYTRIKHVMANLES